MRDLDEWQVAATICECLNITENTSVLRGMINSASQVSSSVRDAEEALCLALVKEIDRVASEPISDAQKSTKRQLLAEQVLSLASGCRDTASENKSKQLTTGGINGIGVLKVKSYSCEGIEQAVGREREVGLLAKLINALKDALGIKIEATSQQNIAPKVTNLKGAHQAQQQSGAGAASSASPEAPPPRPRSPTGGSR